MPQAEDIWYDDTLNVRRVFSNLNGVVSKVPTPFVLNVDSEWGLGKTFLLERWHKEAKEKGQSVFINAWEWDLTHDPLGTIMSEMRRQIGAGKQDSEALRKAFQTGSRIVLAAGKSVLTQLITKYVGVNVTEAIDATQINEDLAQARLDEIESQMETVRVFRKDLEHALSAPSQQPNGPEPRILVFIDELDRCRPGYAIEFLEVLKHLFDVKGLVFVLATNTRALTESLRGIYGQGFQGKEYLRRFFDVSYKLPQSDTSQYVTALLATQPLEVKVQSFGVTVSQVQSLTELALAFRSSLRDLNQIYLRIQMASRIVEGPVFFTHLAFLSFVAFYYPGKIEELAKGKDELWTSVLPGLWNSQTDGRPEKEFRNTREYSGLRIVWSILSGNPPTTGSNALISAFADHGAQGHDIETLTKTVAADRDEYRYYLEAIRFAQRFER